MTIMVREMKVLDIMPDLRKWAQSMRSNPVQSAALVEETLELALEEFEAFIRSPDQRLWLFKLMKDIQRGHVAPRSTIATARSTLTGAAISCR
ncbi:hypothetical protein LPJGGPFB_05181 [Ensifer adhaerens]|uniref:hypothetical protein n=1 Tax=Ensifer adhaerens TaxID=106592 RepID=UPI001568D0E5|nr:hypothetical protein [Ensifer adhaerens]NRP21922.1 hypothetical protein [Ensifer adhaerens]